MKGSPEPRCTCREAVIGQQIRVRCQACVCTYVLGHGRLGVQTETAGVLGQVGWVRVDQSPASPVPLSQPDLFSKADFAPDTHHHHTAGGRHAHTPQPRKVLRASVVSVNQPPLQRHRYEPEGVTMETDSGSGSTHREVPRGAVGTVVQRVQRKWF